RSSRPVSVTEQGVWQDGPTEVRASAPGGSETSASAYPLPPDDTLGIRSLSETELHPATTRPPATTMAMRVIRTHGQPQPPLPAGTIGAAREACNRGQA